MSMKADQENFDQLRRLLAIKRHEQPPPGYFKDFSQQVIMQIRASGPQTARDDADRLVWEAPWLQRFWAALEHNPLMAGGFGVLVCALLISGVIYSENMARPSEVGVIQTETEQPARQPGALVDSSSVIHPVFVQAAATEFSSFAGTPTVEARGLMFDQVQNSPTQERAKPVLFNVPEGGLNP